MNGENFDLKAAFLSNQPTEPPAGDGWINVVDAVPTEAQEVLFVRGGKRSMEHG